MIGAGYVGLVSGTCFSDLGNTVYCVDKDKEVINEIKKKCQEINVVSGNILDFGFPENEYDLILILNVLHFFRFTEVKIIIDKTIKSLRKGGLVYLEVFSTKDPSYVNFIKVAQKIKGEGSFYSKKMKSFVHYFTKEEIIKLFSGNKILEIEEKITRDNHPPIGIHKHSIFFVVVEKV